ncbi:MAG: SCP2 sterol-binding domain-containing protein [Promethearchaeota archaeon]
MSLARDNLAKVIEKMNQNEKAQAVFVTNVAGKDVDWQMSFQFKLDNEEPFYLEIKNRRTNLSEGTNSDAFVVMSGDPNSIVKICNGKGDFTHAISREEITVEKGKVMDVIRLTRAITIVLKTRL